VGYAADLCGNCADDVSVAPEKLGGRLPRGSDERNFTADELVDDDAEGSPENSPEEVGSGHDMAECVLVLQEVGGRPESL
jgi:hypothetical protein